MKNSSLASHTRPESAVVSDCICSVMVVRHTCEAFVELGWARDDSLLCPIVEVQNTGAVLESDCQSLAPGAPGCTYNAVLPDCVRGSLDDVDETQPPIVEDGGEDVLHVGYGVGQQGANGLLVRGDLISGLEVLLEDFLGVEDGQPSALFGRYDEEVALGGEGYMAKLGDGHCRVRRKVGDDVPFSGFLLKRLPDLVCGC